VALPLALITLMLLTTLMLAFGVLAQSEPVIAANQLRMSQARALAESGFEYALWALSQGLVTPGAATTLGSPLPSARPAPFDGTFVRLGGTGGFVASVDNDPGGDPSVRQITSVGWTPSNAPGAGVRAHRRVRGSVVLLPDLARRAPCVLCVRGDLQIGPYAAIDGNNRDTSGTCGGNDRFGTYSEGATTLGAGAGTIAGGNASCAAGRLCVADNQPGAAFDALTYSDAELSALKALALKNGTYFGPGFSGTTDAEGKAVAGTYSGAVRFTDGVGHQVANGVVFVDTIDGVNPDPRGANTGTLATVQIDGHPFVDATGDFTGVIVVNGSLTIAGGMRINGLVYAVNELTYSATGSGAISGLAISQNLRDGALTTISGAPSADAVAGPAPVITFDCPRARGQGFIPPGFVVLPGTYREPPD
jgi:hypothetical protein